MVGAAVGFDLKKIKKLRSALYSVKLYLGAWCMYMYILHSYMQSRCAQIDSENFFT